MNMKMDMMKNMNINHYTIDDVFCSCCGIELCSECGFCMNEKCEYCKCFCYDGDFKEENFYPYYDDECFADY